VNMSRRRRKGRLEEAGPLSPARIELSERLDGQYRKFNKSKNGNIKEF